MRPSIRAATSAGASARDTSLVALDLLELWVGDLPRTRQLLQTAFGFDLLDAQVPCSPGEVVACLGCGEVRLVLRQGASAASPIARHVAVHGDTVGDVALTCAEPPLVVSRALAHGLGVSDAAGGPRIDVTGDGTICHSLRAEALVGTPAAACAAPPMASVDHVTLCLRAGTAERVATAYEEVFGLERVDIGDFEQVGDDATGMRSAVLRSPGLTIVLTEPASEAGHGQTQRFVDAHRGPGVQHAAVAYEDLCAAVEALRRRGVTFLAVPGEYYELTRRQLADRTLAWDALERLEILVDADEHGLLFQLFTRPITDRGTFFVEFIQRSGAAGFGANNVRALFAAVEAAAGSGNGVVDGS